MNFEQYVSNLKSKIEKMEASQEYELKYEIYPPAIAEDLQEMEDEILAEEGMEGFQIWHPLRQFYQVANGFKLSWQYLGNPEKNRITAGTARIALIYAIYDPEDEMGQPFNLLYRNYRLFDWIGVESHVSLKFYPGKPEPELYYYTKDTDSYHLMSVNFIEYMDLLLQTMGLYPWQEFFIADNEFTLEKNKADKFIADLEILFPDADIAKFRV